MGYKVGDEVFIKCKIKKIDRKKLLQLQVEFNDGYTEWFDEDNLIKNQNTYEQGLNDAWELAKKIYQMSEHERYEVFGVPVAFTYDILCEFTVEEALEKIKEYKKGY